MNSNMKANELPLKIKYKRRNEKNDYGRDSESVAISNSQYENTLYQSNKNVTRDNQNLLSAEEIFQFLKNLNDNHTNYQNESINKIDNNSIHYNNISTIGSYINDCIKNILTNDLLNQHIMLPSKSTLVDICEGFYDIDMTEFNNFIIRGKNLIHMGIQSNYGDEVTPDIIWSGLMPAIKKNLNSIKSLFLELPGFKDIKTKDTAALIKSKIPFHYSIKYASLYFNNEFYCFFDNGIHYKLPYVRLTLGDKLANELFSFFEDFNKLNLTKREKSLMIPLAITISTIDMPDDVDIRKLYEIYLDAFKNEVKLNKRDAKFWQELNRIVSRLPRIYQLDVEFKKSMEQK